MKDPWADFRRFTQARIGQGRVGSGIPTSAQLDFQLAHAMARDAVHQIWRVDEFAEALMLKGLQPLVLATPISHREQYLLRPDLGRCLDHPSRQLLQSQINQSIDVALIISNGLSSTAVDQHGLGLLDAIVTAYASCKLSLGPICLTPNARVAVADEIGSLLNARLSVIIVGERPGLSASDSLGVYMTYSPSIGNTDADRNCLSNIRPPAGLSYETAASKLAYLTLQALQRGISGVALKDDLPSHSLEQNVSI